MKTTTSDEQREHAEIVAIRGLEFLASDFGRLEPFLSLSGLQPGRLREAAAEPGFLAGVLDHIAGDETLLLAFSASAGLHPTDIVRARQILGGPPADWGA